jgi:hypothetical protein
MLQHVLHNLSSDNACRRILRNIVSVIMPGFSKLLIKDLLFPNRNVPWGLKAMDVNVFQSLAGQEPTETQFRELLESAGFKIDGIWSHPNAIDVVIEASLAWVRGIVRPVTSRTRDEKLRILEHDKCK